jgi:hypothetical protein
MFGGAKQNSARGFCEVFLNSGLTQVGSDIVRQGLGVSILDGFGKNLELLESIIFTSSNMPLLIVRCSYTQEILKHLMTPFELFQRPFI